MGASAQRATHIYAEKQPLNWRNGGCQPEQPSWDPISLIKSKYIPAYSLYFYLHVVVKVFQGKYLYYSGIGIFLNMKVQKSSIK